MKNGTSSEIWRQRVEEFLKTNQTQASWCKENNYAPKTFSYWFRRFKGVFTQLGLLVEISVKIL